RRHRARNVVLDPVMTASSGAKLLHDDAIDALRALMSQARLVAPNLPEAAVLTGATQARDEDEMYGQAQKLLTLGAGAVVMQGGKGRGSRQCRYPGGGPVPPPPFRAAHRDTQHPRHRLHACFRNRCWACQEPFPRGRGAPSQGLCHGRTRGGWPARNRIRLRTGAPLPQVVGGAVRLPPALPAALTDARERKRQLRPANLRSAKNWETARYRR